MNTVEDTVLIIKIVVLIAGTAFAGWWLWKLIMGDKPKY